MTFRLWRCFKDLWDKASLLRGDRGAEKEGKTESSPLEEAQAGPVATDDVKRFIQGVSKKTEF